MIRLDRAFTPQIDTATRTAELSRWADAVCRARSPLIHGTARISPFRSRSLAPR